MLKFPPYLFGAMDFSSQPQTLFMCRQLKTGRLKFSGSLIENFR